jgi:D-glycero-D-manno-heptose 1,7-bisphosphate phosphatase
MFSAIFLDRDGVINKKIDNDYVKTWDEFKFIKDAPEAIAFLRKQCKYLIVVTNQRGIAKGVMSIKSLEQIHDKMLIELNDKGAYIDGVYYCPEEEGSYCRKPNTGMAMEAKSDFPEIDFGRSLMIGDSKSDLEFGKKLGMKTIWVDNANIAIPPELFNLKVISIKELVQDWSKHKYLRNV